jgi:hypothetical protein
MYVQKNYSGERFFYNTGYSKMGKDVLWVVLQEIAGFKPEKILCDPVWQ